MAALETCLPDPCLLGLNPANGIEKRPAYQKREPATVTLHPIPMAFWDIPGRAFSKVIPILSGGMHLQIV
jgi:hypothetical protein